MEIFTTNTSATNKITASKNNIKMFVVSNKGLNGFSIMLICGVMFIYLLVPWFTINIIKIIVVSVNGGIRRSSWFGEIAIKYANITNIPPT